MSPQDRVERVLKEIHVTFSQCPTYNGEPDKIIVDRKQFLQLLDRLNNGIFDMMEKYEQTRQSRLNAERAFKKKGEEIIDQANTSAEDIYAASVLYTADAIGRIRELMDRTNESMNDLFIQFRKDLRERKDILRSHESELQAQLADLSDTKKYLSVLQDINREREKSNRDSKALQETADPAVKTKIHTPAQSVDVKVNEAYFEKTGKERPDAAKTDPAAAAGEKPDIKVNTDAAYFKWKAEQETKGKGAESPEDLQEDLPERSAKRPEERTGGKSMEKVMDESPGNSAERFEEKSAGHVPERAKKEQTDEEAMIENILKEDISNVLAGEEKSEHPNPEFPDEESIRRAVLEDERAFDAEQEDAKGRDVPGAGHILKTLIFGKDE